MNILKIKHFVISNFGNVKNTKTNNIRTSCPKGRIQFDESTILSVGRLVALTFLAEPGKEKYINFSFYREIKDFYINSLRD